MKKFKAYDKENNKMSLPFLLSDLTVKWEDDIETPIGHILFSKNFTLCQYMGFNDVDGTEIYEFDKVSILSLDFRGAPNSEDFHTDNGFDGEGYNKTLDEWEEREKDLPWSRYYEVAQDIVTMSRLPRFWLYDETFGNEGEGLIRPEYSRVIESSLIKRG